MYVVPITAYVCVWSYVDYIEPLVDRAGWAWVASAGWVLMDLERAEPRLMRCIARTRRAVWWDETVGFGASAGAYDRTEGRLYRTMGRGGPGS